MPSGATNRQARVRDGRDGACAVAPPNAHYGAG